MKGRAGSTIAWVGNLEVRLTWCISSVDPEKGGGDPLALYLGWRDDLCAYCLVAGVHQCVSLQDVVTQLTSQSYSCPLLLMLY